MTQDPDHRRGMTGRVPIISIAVAGFVALGMPTAALGVAWPSIADSLGRSLGDLGVLVVVMVGAGILSGVITGDVLDRFGAGPALTASTALAAAALAGFAAAPGWGVLLAAAAALGLAHGLLDAGVNAHVSITGGMRAMGGIHAGFGIGSMLGALLPTALLAVDVSWRVGFAVLAVVHVPVVAAFGATHRRWRTGAERRDRSARRPRPESRAALFLGLFVYLVNTGVESGAGQWTFTLLTESRGLGEGIAGLAVGGYWALLTVSRVLLGIAGDRVRADRLLAISLGGTVAGLGLLWWNPLPWAGPLGLLVTGFALGPLFPVYTMLTPQRVGNAFTPWAVGYQLAAAGAGAAVVPGGIGLLVAAIGLGGIGPALFAVGSIQAAAGGALRRTRPKTPS